ncbi:hypothetical protein ATCC90586_011872 [Pythium insidiosum]|nr:hypothetical protein ATCC90586_011872 [Pythium insidiosum]
MIAGQLCSSQNADADAALTPVAKLYVSVPRVPLRWPEIGHVAPYAQMTSTLLPVEIGTSNCDPPASDRWYENRSGSDAADDSCAVKNDWSGSFVTPDDEYDEITNDSGRPTDRWNSITLLSGEFTIDADRESPTANHPAVLAVPAGSTENSMQIWSPCTSERTP